MNRITEAERNRFHKILDDSIDKMNNPKNANKEHWKHNTIPSLQKNITIENAELDLAVWHRDDKNLIETETFDVINYGLFIVDNLRGNK